MIAIRSWRDVTIIDHSNDLTSTALQEIGHRQGKQTLKYLVDQVVKYVVALFHFHLVGQYVCCYPDVHC